MKKGILIYAFGDDRWAGGLYYPRNIALELSRNTYIRQKYKIIILTTQKHFDFFKKISSNIIKVYCVHKNRKYILLIEKFLVFKFENIKFIFPQNKPSRMKDITNISWIPDFQHKYYPKFFSNKEINRRDIMFKNIMDSASPLVLSSNCSYLDAEKFYGTKENMYVVPFVSYIEQEIYSLKRGAEKEILDKYSLSNKKYACICNQFWRHKNHIVIFRAIEYLAKKNELDDFIFVFTGYPEDDRDPDYYQEISLLINSQVVKKHILILGFIDRNEQITLMKNSEYIIQPSLFEGWGTVLEDAKVLDKTILLSDIPVHREQKNDKCILFAPNNMVYLAELIVRENQKDHNDNIKIGISDMHRRADEYSKGFVQLIKDSEN